MERWKLFTDDELYAMLNALTFAAPSFSDAAGGGQFAGSWKGQGDMAAQIKCEITSVLRDREGT
jgi:hypothetical protein